MHIDRHGPAVRWEAATLHRRRDADPLAPLPRLRRGGVRHELCDARHDEPEVGHAGVRGQPERVVVLSDVRKGKELGLKVVYMRVCVHYGCYWRCITFTVYYSD